MGEVWAPVAVTEWTASSGAPCWRVTHQRPDGTTHGHIFPQGALEWRMAEYRLDSVNEALDMVLHEPWATDPGDPVLARDDAAVRAGMVTRAPGPRLDYDPITLTTADTIDDARAAHLIRIADAKTRVRIAPPAGKPDPLDVIRQRHGATEAGIRDKAAMVDAARRAYRGEAPPPQPDTIVGTLAGARTIT